jgi:hypothetical protein
MIDLANLYLNDFSKLSLHFKIKIEIINTTHSFYPHHSSSSGMNYPTQPICHVNNIILFYFSIIIYNVRFTNFKSS